MNSARVAGARAWFDAAALAEALISRWRERPAYRTPLRAEGFPATLLVPNYDAVARVLRSKCYARDPCQADENALYFSAMGRASDKVSGKAAAAPLEQMLFLDGAAHERARRPIAVAIGQAQRSFPAMLSSIVDGVLEELGEKTQIDLVRDYASKISLRAISVIIGIEPATDGLRELAEDVFGFFISASSENAVERGRYAFDELAAMMVKHVHEMRSADIDERGIFSSLVRENHPHILSAQEWGVQLAGLFVAGSLTTADLIASACLVLLAFPDIKKKILADGALIHGLVEEVLRLEPPSTFSYRIATRDGSVAGCPYSKGEILGGFNRSSQRFENGGM